MKVGGFRGQPVGKTWRACCSLVAAAARKAQQGQQVGEDVIDVQIQAQGGADVVGFAAVDDLLHVIQDVRREDGIRDVERSRGLGDVYKRQRYKRSVALM